jgi:N-acetylglucosaminyl-diphospho-decaprenol L-rhamnosyltransferase
MAIHSPDPVVDVTIIGVSYNSARLLPDLLASLPDATAGLDSHEVVIVDNASSDDSVTIVRESAPGVNVIALPKNVGYAGGINAGVDAAKPSKAILVLNDDIRLHEGAIVPLLKAVGDPGVGIAVPLLVDPAGRLLKSLRREPSVSRIFGEAILGGDRSGRFERLGEVVQDPAAYKRRSSAAWASGSAWLISRRCWDAVGLWDESYFLYAEDIDFALRSRDAGYSLVLVPEARATHLVGPSHRDPRLWSMSVWNRYRVFRRRHGPIHSAAFRLGLILNELIRALMGRTIHRAGLAALVMESRRPPEVR